MNIMRAGLLVVGGIMMLSVPTTGQRRVTGDKKPTVGVAIALKTGGSGYEFTGQASCTHAPVASIYGVVAEQRSVEHSDAGRSLHLTLWKPKSGSSEMFSISVTAGTSAHSVDTVKATGAPPTRGSGKVNFSAAGKGGAFVIDAKAADGTPITGTIKCDAFLPAVAEGG
jgi:hypothetical protein